MNKKKYAKIAFKVINFAILIVVINLTFSMFTMALTSLNTVMDDLSAMDIGTEMDDDAMAKLQQDVQKSTFEIYVLQGKARSMFETMHGLNVVILERGAAALEILGQKDAADTVRAQGDKVQLRLQLLEFAADLEAPETGAVDSEELKNVEEDFDDLEKLVKLAKQQLPSNNEEEK